MRGGEGDGARPLAVSRGGLPWTPQAPGTTKPPRKPPELGWRRRRKAGRPSAETAVCGRAARRRRWPGQLGRGGGTGSLRGHLGGATWRKGAVSHDAWPQQRLRRVQGPLCRSVTSGHGQCALPGRSHSLTRRQRRPEARQGPKRHEGVRELAQGPELATGEQECLLGSQPEAPSNEGARAELSGHCGAGVASQGPWTPALPVARPQPAPAEPCCNDRHPDTMSERHRALRHPRLTRAPGCRAPLSMVLPKAKPLLLGSHSIAGQHVARGLGSHSGRPPGSQARERASMQRHGRPQVWELWAPPSLATGSRAQRPSERGLPRCFHGHEQVTLRRTRVLRRQRHHLYPAEASCCQPVGPQRFRARPGGCRQMASPPPAARGRCRTAAQPALQGLATNPRCLEGRRAPGKLLCDAGGGQ